MQRGIIQLVSLKANCTEAALFCMVDPQPLGHCLCWLYKTSADLCSEVRISACPSIDFDAMVGSNGLKCKGIPDIHIG